MITLEVYENQEDGRFHYQAREVGAKNSKHTDMLCGRPVAGLRHAAWFPVDDERGRVHFDRACGECRRMLVT